MYNPAQKQQYISDNLSQGSVGVARDCRDLFNTISQYENELDKDLSEMNVNETKIIMNSLQMLSSSTIVTTITKLRSYVQWCIDTKLMDGENPFDHININDIDVSTSIKGKLLSSPKHLQSILEGAFPADSNVEFKEQSQLMAWFIFLGLSPDCIRALKKSDILYSEKCVIDENGEHVPITDEMLTLAKYCSEQVTLDRRDSITTKRVYPLNDNEYLFRTTVNGRSDPNAPVGQMLLISRIRSISMNYAENTGIKFSLSINRIYHSGVFFKLYKLEEAGNIITNEIVYKYFKMRHENKTTIMNESRRKRLDYLNWKEHRRKYLWI